MMASVFPSGASRDLPRGRGHAGVGHGVVDFPDDAPWPRPRSGRWRRCRSPPAICRRACRWPGPRNFHGGIGSCRSASGHAPAANRRGDRSAATAAKSTVTRAGLRSGRCPGRDARAPRIASPKPAIDRAIESAVTVSLSRAIFKPFSMRPAIAPNGWTGHPPDRRGDGGLQQPRGRLDTGGRPRQRRPKPSARRQTTAGQPCSEPVASAGQPTANRSHRAPKRRGGLVVRPALEIAEHHRGAVLRRQPVDFAVQQGLELAVLDGG